MVVKRILEVKDKVKRIPSKVIHKNKMHENMRKLRENKEISEETMRKIAECKMIYKKSFKLHLFFFILGNVILFTINLLFTPSYLWALYPLIGWMITGTSIHIAAYVLFLRGVYPMYKRSVIYNFLAYMTVIPLLFLINFTTDGTISWVFYPTIFWGIGLITLVIIYYAFIKDQYAEETDGKSKREISIEKEIEKMRNSKRGQV